jgi:hypothetical protein
MADKDSHRKKYIRLKDKAGSEFLCPLDALKSIKDATEEELAECVEEDVVGRYSGDIEIVKQASATPVR